MSKTREEQMDELVAELGTRDWNGEGADAVTKESADLAKTLLPCLPPSAAPIPTVSGGFAFEWDDENGKTRNVEVWAEP